MGIERQLKNEQFFRCLLRILPTVILTVLAVIGLLFPDDIKVVAQNNWTPFSGLVAFLGIIQVILVGVYETTSRKPEPSPLTNAEFMQLYTTPLVDTISVLPLLEVASNEERARIVSDLLKNICTVVEAYKGDVKTHNHGFNACWFEAQSAAEISEDNISSARPFMDSRRDAYKEFLVLRSWAYLGTEPIEITKPRGPFFPAPCVSPGFTLPIDEDLQHTLLGAPYAYKTGEYHVIPNIKDEQALRKCAGMFNESICREMIRFFSDRQSYQSFVDVPVLYGTTRVGVVSIQSRQANSWNLKAETDLHMLKAIEPYLAIIAVAAKY